MEKLKDRLSLIFYLSLPWIFILGGLYYNARSYELNCKQTPGATKTCDLRVQIFGIPIHTQSQSNLESIRLSKYTLLVRLSGEIHSLPAVNVNENDLVDFQQNNRSDLFVQFNPLDSPPLLVILVFLILLFVFYLKWISDSSEFSVFSDKQK